MRTRWKRTRLIRHGIPVGLDALELVAHGLCVRGCAVNGQGLVGVHHLLGRFHQLAGFVLAGLGVSFADLRLSLAGRGLPCACFGFLGLGGAGGHAGSHAVGAGFRVGLRGLRVGLAGGSFRFAALSIGLTGLRVGLRGLGRILTCLGIGLRGLGLGFAGLGRILTCLGVGLAGLCRAGRTCRRRSRGCRSVLACPGCILAGLRVGLAHLGSILACLCRIPCRFGLTEQFFDVGDALVHKVPGPLHRAGDVFTDFPAIDRLPDTRNDRIKIH